MRVVALVGDLMDRSRISAAVPGVEFTSDVAETAHADVVVVDLARNGADLAAVRATAPDAHVLAFGPHVDDDLLAQATADGADVVMPRSRFFRDPADALTVR